MEQLWPAACDTVAGRVVDRLTFCRQWVYRILGGPSCVPFALFGSDVPSSSVLLMTVTSYGRY